MRDAKISKEKMLRDVNNVCRYARFVICVDSDGRIVNVIDRPDGKAQLIAIVSVVEVLGESCAEQVLFEIGCGRTRPYASIEKEGKLLMKERNMKEVFPLHLHPHVFHALADCIESVVIEKCARWKNLGERFVEGIGYVPVGVTFTVARDDEYFYRQMLIEDIKRQKKRNIDKHVRAITRWVGHYKRSHYSDVQLRKFRGAQKTAELLATYEERPRHRDVLLRRFREGSHVREIIDRIIMISNINFESVDPERDLLAKHFFVNPVSLRALWVRLRKKPTHHAKDSLVIEVGVVCQQKILKMKEMMHGDIQS